MKRLQIARRRLLHSCERQYRRAIDEGCETITHEKNFLVLLFALTLLNLFSCREKEKKANFESDKYIPVMGPLKDTAIGKSGIRMSLPELYRIDEMKGDSFAEYRIHPATPANNKSSIKLHIGEHADTTAPAGNYWRTGPVVNGDWTWVQYASGETVIRRDYIGNWSGKKVMLEEITTNPVERNNLDRVMKTIRIDSTPINR